MPNDWLTAHFNHWFWLDICFLDEARSKTARQYDGFHCLIPNLKRSQLGGRGLSPIALFAPAAWISFYVGLPARALLRVRLKTAIGEQFA
jgi:hypothetical protein